MIQTHFADLLCMVLMCNLIDFNVTAEKGPYKLTSNDYSTERYHQVTWS